MACLLPSVIFIIYSGHKTHQLVEKEMEMKKMEKMNQPMMQNEFIQNAKVPEYSSPTVLTREDENTNLTVPKKRVIMDKCNVSRHFEIYVLMVLTRMGVEIYMSYVQASNSFFSEAQVLLRGKQHF